MGSRIFLSFDHIFAPPFMAAAKYGTSFGSGAILREGQYPVEKFNPLFASTAQAIPESLGEELHQRVSVINVPYKHVIFHESGVHLGIPF